MKIQYSHELPVSKHIAFDAITDPNNLQNVIPGCESFEISSPNCYLISSKLKFGSIQGVYKSKLEIIDINQPDSLRLTLNAKGTGARIQGEVTMIFNTLPGVTQVVVEGYVKVAGFAAIAGQNILSGAANVLLKQFFSSLKYNNN